MCKKLSILLIFAAFSSQALLAQIGVKIQQKSDFYQMLKSTEASQRRSAVDNIGRKKNSKDAPVLIEMLNDPDPGVKIAACDALGLMREQSATDKIISLLDDKEPQVRQSACVALGYIGNPKAKPELVKRVTKDSSDSVRTQAILILGNMRAEESVDTLIDVLEDKNLDVRLLSVQALGKIEDQKASPAVKKCLMNAISEMKGETDNFRLGQYRRLISESAKTLGNLKDTSAEGELKELLDNDDSSIKLSAASALGQLGNKSGLSIAEKLTKDDNIMIRTQAVQALGNIGDSSSIPILEKIFENDTNRNIKEAARNSLYRCGWKPPKKTKKTAK
ncbi:MAG: HEAT repeat domain-containing protein [Elusimicrobia bacterium]|nr:HEAT repeat domain-containing protein [Elusimicrobiota bacterium]